MSRPQNVYRRSDVRVCGMAAAHADEVRLGNAVLLSRVTAYRTSPGCVLQIDKHHHPVCPIHLIFKLPVELAPSGIQNTPV